MSIHHHLCMSSSARWTTLQWINGVCSSSNISLKTLSLSSSSSSSKLKQQRFFSTFMASTSAAARTRTYTTSNVDNPNHNNDVNNNTRNDKDVVTQFGSLEDGRSFRSRTFCDKRRISVRAGSGGSGSLNNATLGGRGGDVILEAGETGLSLRRLQQRYVAGHGGNGSKSQLVGDDGRPLLLTIPAGTRVTDIDTGEVIADMDKYGMTVTVAEGGAGGDMETDFHGVKGRKRNIQLELKSIADVGLVGYPNAGKSTFLRAVTSARPKVDSYPFTTIRPTVGMVESELAPFSIADIPGIIEGASENRGMGHRFLRHIERTRILIVMVDVTGFQLSARFEHCSAAETLRQILNELKKYNAETDLCTRKMIVVANKMDVEGASEYLKQFQEELPVVLAEAGVNVHSAISISAGQGDGLAELKTLLSRLCVESDNDGGRSRGSMYWF